MKRCEYCNTEGEGQFCDNCSAEFIEKKDNFVKGEPFFYNGYIVWWTHSFDSAYHKVYFYLGERLVEIIEFPISLLYQIEGFSEGKSMFPFVWELFKVAQGEEEVLEVQEKNSVPPAMFEIRRIKPEEISEKEAIGLWLHEYG